MYSNFEVKFSLEIQSSNRITVSWERSLNRIEKLSSFSKILIYLFRLYVWICCDVMMNFINNWIQNSIPFVKETDSTLFKMIIDYCLERLMKKTAVLFISIVFEFFNGEVEITHNK